MAVTTTQTDLDPIVFLDGEPVEAETALAVVEMVNWAMAQTQQRIAWQLPSGVLIGEVVQFELEIPTWASSLEAHVEVTPLDPSVALDIDIDIGADQQTVSTSAGDTEGTATFAVADTGTGYVSVSITGTVTAGTDTASLDALEIRMTPVAAADLPCVYDDVLV